MLLLLLTLDATAQHKPAPSKIMPADGDYMCKIDSGYKMRPCTISTADGVTTLSIPEGLIGIKAALYPVQDSKNQIFADAKLTDERSFGCYSCNAQCAANPDTCTCRDVPAVASNQCMNQAITFVLTKKGQKWTGKLPLKNYYNTYKDGKPVDWEAEVMFLDVVIQPAKKKKKQSK